MLVLTRRFGQAIQIGPDIRVFVLPTNRKDWFNGIRIGIEAPKHINIWRVDDPYEEEGDRGRNK